MSPSNILEVAIKNNKLEIVKDLLEQKVRFFDNHLNKYNNTYLNIAINTGFNDIAIYLISQFPREVYNNLAPNIISNAIISDNIAMIKAFAKFIHNNNDEAKE